MWIRVKCNLRSNVVVELNLDGFSLSGHVRCGLLQLQSLETLTRQEQPHRSSQSEDCTRRRPVGLTTFTSLSLISLNSRLLYRRTSSSSSNRCRSTPSSSPTFFSENRLQRLRSEEVYEDLLAFTGLSFGGGLGCYGILLLHKLRNVRSEKASSEMWKIGGLAVASVICFTSSATSSALVALLIDVPLYDPWSLKTTYGRKALFLLILYYFIGSLVPSAFALWFIRKLPPPITNHQHEQSRIISFISYVEELCKGEHGECPICLEASHRFLNLIT